MIKFFKTVLDKIMYKWVDVTVGNRSHSFRLAAHNPGITIRVKQPRFGIFRSKLSKKAIKAFKTHPNSLFVVAPVLGTLPLIQLLRKSKK